ncbi:HD-GYP domain-containing protein [Streptomyces sp. NBC_00102]|uniref:HD-GYP domain-containing protein n=1 Tax=Streptomyces sp. NBC_00102 TaxID=2975652 RepID=UPI00224F7F15|nr:metal-dependent phosphohydrolase [Streptomyces sp. NBC_00102]MCX5399636.1 metal-dependent phosphohydrolase [Streptomyces sp. NBC_00102]
MRAAALALTLVALVHTLWSGLAEPGHALAFGALVTVGELACRGALPGEREPAPLGAAGALAYALLGRSAGEPTGQGVLQVITVVTAAQLLAAVPPLVRGSGPDPDRAARRVLTVAFAAVCFQPLRYAEQFTGSLGEGPAYALFLVGLLGLTALCDAVLAAFVLAARTRCPYGSHLRDELRALPGIGSAVCATGAVMALGVAVAGLWALPVLCVPLLLTQVSFRRYAAVRATYRQTIVSLARATEIAGYTPQGHARRVADLCTAVGRELGLAGSELTVLEYAALMHDIGQLSLVDPLEDGATARLPAAEQRRIALLGGAVVRQTGVDAKVAVVVERQADPYREQPLTARIVRTVNAYEDLCGEGVAGALAALEELRIGTGHDYQPQVVEALAGVLARGGPPRVGAG